MTKEQEKDLAIQGIVELLRDNPFKIEFVAKKKPKGVRVIVEMTQEQIDAFVKESISKRNKQISN